MTSNWWEQINHETTLGKWSNHSLTSSSYRTILCARGLPISFWWILLKGQHSYRDSFESILRGCVECGRKWEPLLSKWDRERSGYKSNLLKWYLHTKAHLCCKEIYYHWMVMRWGRGNGMGSIHQTGGASSSSSNFYPRHLPNFPIDVSSLYVEL